MVSAESFSSGSEQITMEHRPSEELSGATAVAVRAAASDQRLRRGIGDLDRATCRTRLSQRQFLIQLQADSAGDFRSGPERLQRGMMNNHWSGKVVDWD